MPATDSTHDGDTSDGETEQSYPSLPATSWAVLGMLTLGEKLTGYDLKKWADWNIGYFYWSPSVSQVYAELKKLEKAGYVASEVVSEPGERGRRIYQITESGTRAVRNWSRDAPVDQPVLKHGPMLRLWMGHLNEPDQLKDIVHSHIANLTRLRDQSRKRAEMSVTEPAWAFSVMSLQWASRHYQAEIDLAEGLLAEIDRAVETYSQLAGVDELGNPIPNRPGLWRTPPAELVEMLTHSAEQHPDTL